MMDKETMCERWRDELRKCSRHCDYVVAGMLAHEDFANSKKERKALGLLSKVVDDLDYICSLIELYRGSKNG